MRHRLGNRKLGRPTDQRRALLRSIVSALFKSGKIKVTLMRAKEVRRVAEKLITVTRENDLHARRKAERVLADKELVAHIFKTFPERFEGRAGGYTRIIKIGRRAGDAAQMAILELV